MKRYNFLGSLTILFLLSFVACNKKASDSPTPNSPDIFSLLRKTNSDSIFAAISVVASASVLDVNSGALPAVEVKASFGKSNEPSGTLDAGLVSIGNVSMTKNQQTGYRSSGRSNSLIANLGTNLECTVQGTAQVPALKTTFYAPKILNTLNIIAPGYDGRNISIKGGQVLSWNADDKNPNKVLVCFIYDKVFTDPNASGYNNLPNNSVLNYKLIDDTGSYTIQAADFAGMPVGANVRILVARGNDTLVKVGSNNLNYVLYSLTYIQHALMMIP